MQRLKRLIEMLEQSSAFAAATIVFVIMILVVTDVLMRYGFGHPIGWTYDVTSIYLMVAWVYLSVSETYFARAHVSVDLFYYMFPPPLQRLVDLITNLVGLFIFVLISFVSFEDLMSTYQMNDVLTGAISWPTWPKFAFVLFGSIVLVVRLAISLISNIVSLITGNFEEDALMPKDNEDQVFQ